MTKTKDHSVLKPVPWFLKSRLSSEDFFIPFHSFIHLFTCNFWALPYVLCSDHYSVRHRGHKKQPDRMLKLKGLWVNGKRHRGQVRDLDRPHWGTKKDTLDSCRPETGKAALRRGGHTCYGRWAGAFLMRGAGMRQLDRRRSYWCSMAQLAHNPPNWQQLCISK